MVLAARGHRRLLRAGAQLRRGAAASAQRGAAGLRRGRRCDAAGARTAFQRDACRGSITTGGRRQRNESAARVGRLFRGRDRGAGGRRRRVADPHQWHFQCTAPLRSRRVCCGREPRYRVAGLLGAHGNSIAGRCAGHRTARLLQRPDRRELPRRGVCIHPGWRFVRQRPAADEPGIDHIQRGSGLCAGARPLGTIGQVRRHRPAHCAVRFRRFQRGAAGPRHCRSRGSEIPAVGQLLRSARAVAEGIRGLQAGPDHRGEPAGVRPGGTVRREPACEPRHESLVVQAGAGRVAGAGPVDPGGHGRSHPVHRQRRFLPAPDPVAGSALFVAGARDLQLPVWRLGLARRDLFRRRSHDAGRHAATTTCSRTGGSGPRWHSQ